MSPCRSSIVSRVTPESIHPWVVEVRFPTRSYRAQVLALWRDLDHLQRELIDTSDEVGLSVNVLAADEADAIAYIESRITGLHGDRLLRGVDYGLAATPRTGD